MFLLCLKDDKTAGLSKNILITGSTSDYGRLFTTLYDCVTAYL